MLPGIVELHSNGVAAMSDSEGNTYELCPVHCSIIAHILIQYFVNADILFPPFRNVIYHLFPNYITLYHVHSYTNSYITHNFLYNVTSLN